MTNDALPTLHAIKESIKQQRASMFRLWMRVAARPFPLRDGPTLIVAPHPDDEVLGCGGLIALKLTHGADVRVVFVTGGEAAHDACCAVDRDSIAARRRRLAETALSELGVCSTTSWLGFPDGRVPLPGEEGFERLAFDIARSIEASRAHDVFAPHYCDNHRDHTAVSLATIRARAYLDRPTYLYFYCVWTLHVFPNTPVLPVLAEQPLALRISDVQEEKNRAVSAYFRERVENCGAPVSGRLPNRLLANCVSEQEFYFRAAAKADS